MIIFLVSDVFLADWNAKHLQDFHEFSSTASFPNSQNAFIIAAPLAWILARIPGLNKVNIKTEWVQDKLGFFAEPLVLGFHHRHWCSACSRGSTCCGPCSSASSRRMMFHVWPMALGVTFEGWAVFNEGMRKILVKWFKGKREVYVAVDTSVLLGHPSVGVSTTLMYPIAFLLSIFVPGIGLFPVISVQIIQWWMAHITGLDEGQHRPQPHHLLGAGGACTAWPPPPWPSLTPSGRTSTASFPRTWRGRRPGDQLGRWRRPAHLGAVQAVLV